MTLRLAVLGHGFISDLHTRAAHEVGAVVVEVCGRDLERASAFASRHGIERVSTDWESTVVADDVDAVIIGTPNALHHPQAMAAIAAGKHVLVDKPMALNVDEGTEMAAAAATADVVLCVQPGVTTMAWLSRMMRELEGRGRRLRAVVLWSADLPVAA
jgi:predicted dehydrogenase